MGNGNHIRPKSYRTLVISGIILLSAAVHLLAFLVERDSPDMRTWLITAKAVSSLQDFYKATSPPSWNLPYWYPPLWAITLGSLALIVNPSTSPALFLLIVRSLLMFGNFVTGLIILKAFKGNLTYFTFWMLNPLVIGVAQSGQFDVLPTLLSMLAYIAHKKGRASLTGIFAGLGFCFKYWPILLVPLYIADRRDDGSIYMMKLMGSAILTAAVICLTFAMGTQYIKSISNAIGLDSARPIWNASSQITELFALVMLAFMGFTIYRLRPSLSLTTSLTITIILIALSNHIQYALWLLPYLTVCLIEYFSVTLALLGNMLWLAHSINRYNNTIQKLINIDMAMPTTFFDIIYSAIAIFISWMILRDRNLKRI